MNIYRWTTVIRSIIDSIAPRGRNLCYKRANVLRCATSNRGSDIYVRCVAVQFGVSVLLTAALAPIFAACAHSRAVRAEAVWDIWVQHGRCILALVCVAYTPSTCRLGLGNGTKWYYIVRINLHVYGENISRAFSGH